MKYTKFRYIETADVKELLLHGFDGAARLVRFKTAEMARAARTPGRTEIDCVAIEHGLLPAGGTTVSAPTPRPIHALIGEVGIADPGSYTPEGQALLAETVRQIANSGAAIDEESDRRTRAAKPDDARRYEQLIAALADSEVYHR